MQDPSWEEALFVDRIGLDPDARVTPFVALQRVVIRMLFDPAFVDRVYGDPDEALAGLDLEPALVDQLLANDRRLWNADRLRRWRALRILIDEFKVSSTLVLLERRELSFLDAFFGSDVFHAAVAERGYMALAFVRYLEDALADGRLERDATRAALRLEGEMARSRRELRDARRGYDRALHRAELDGPGLVVEPGVRSVFLPGRTLDLVGCVERWLFQSSQVPALALCRDAPSPEPLPELGGRPVAYLLEPEPRGRVELSEIPDSFGHLIGLADRPVDVETLRRRAAEVGIDPADVEELADQLLEAGILRRVSAADCAPGGGRSSGRAGSG